MVTLEGIFLWNYHPYREAEGLVRERVGHWTILRAVATPVPESKSNPIQHLNPVILSMNITKTYSMAVISVSGQTYFQGGPYRVRELLILKLKGNENCDELCWTMTQYIFQLCSIVYVFRVK